MKELNFETGLVTYSLNGRCEVTFNPTDSNFVAKLYSAFEELDKKQESYKQQIEKMANKKEIFELTNKMDSEMRKIIDETFGVPICNSLFGEMNVYAVSGGLPVWSNLMLSVIDEIDSSFSREQRATNPRIQKYLSKYHR